LAEFLPLVPAKAWRILVVGKGIKALAQALHTSAGKEVMAIEFEQLEAFIPHLTLDQGLVQQLEQNAKLPFDVIVLVDVLEHVPGLERLLRRMAAWLRPEGALLGSVPNARHHRVAQALLDGSWPCHPHGDLAPIPLRLFTRQQLEILCFRSGLQSPTWRPIPGPGYDDWNERGRAGNVAVGRLQISGLSATLAEEFYAGGYIFSTAVQPPTAYDYGLTSIVILTHNQLSYTRLCVDSIRQCTDEPYELIFVDNASTDGTVEYLQSLGNIKLVLNAENRGFPAAANQGMQLAVGRQILLLNNDTVVPTGWLRR
jgi:SAM-dependent methyltransferase